jgi:hypothetical protein
MKVRRIEEPEFSRLQVTWNEVLDNSRADEVFLLWEWIDSWWNIFRSANRELFILAAVNDLGEVIGFAPLYRETVSFLGIRYAKILKLCGDPETCPDHMDFFCREHWEGEFVKAIFRYLRANEQAWDYIDLNGLSDSSIIKDFLTPGDAGWDGLRWDWRDDSDCPYLDTAGSFGGYLESFSAKKRYTLLKKRRILGKEEEFSVKDLKAAHEIEKYYDTLVSLHVERAERKRIKSTFSEEKAASFHKRLIGALVGQDKVALTLLYKKDIPLAAYYCYRHNRKYYFYQSGISRDGEEHSAGLVLLSRMIEKCFDERQQEFDFLRGAEEYKNYWTKTSRKNLALGISRGNRGGNWTRMIYDWQKKAPMAREKIRKMLMPGRGGTG